MRRGNNKIKLHLHNKDGDLTVSPTLKVLKLGDTQGIVWEIDGASELPIKAFTCNFYDGTPFADLSFSNARPASGGLRPNLDLRSYHYSVTVTSDDRIYEIAGCPEVIIRAS
jgi:hypothetical protein